jgi:short-subunit dehydrogenase
MRKIAILGASRGLGRALAIKTAKKDDAANLLLVARRAESLSAVADSIQALPGTEVSALAADFSKESDWERVLESLKSFSPHQIFYCAAGGPYGAFADKGWKDHLWAFKVSFLFPARVLHFAMQELKEAGLEQIILVGSAVAEESPDPFASSYAASKHALKGLVTSVQAENPSCDLRLYSPSYMDTELLPKNAWPRKNGESIARPEVVAENLIDWAASDQEKENYFCAR